MEESVVIDLLRETKETLDKHNVEFWLGAGTLLGAVRNGKLIPWENDVDLYAWDMNVSGNTKKLVADELFAKGFQATVFEHPTPFMHIHHGAEDVWVDLNFYRLVHDRAVLPVREQRRLVGTLLLRLCRALLHPHPYRVDPGSPVRKKGLLMERILVAISSALPRGLRRLLARISAKAYDKIGTKDVSQVFPAAFFEDLSTVTFHGMEFKAPGKKEAYLAFRYGEDWQTPKRDWVTERDDGAVVNKAWRKKRRGN